MRNLQKDHIGEVTFSNLEQIGTIPAIVSKVVLRIRNYIF